MPIDVVAIIPARGGSKGLLRKNLRIVGGLPLVAHSILAGLESSRVDATYVSTEDEEIAAVALQHRARLIKRPAELAPDTVQNNAVLRHALHAIRSDGHHPKTLVLLQPTSPFRRASHVDAALELFDRRRGLRYQHL